ncbi:MAG: STAS domain-containing protein [Chitinophagales bacterium]
MQIATERQNHTLILTLRGRLDAFQSEELKKLINSTLSEQDICVALDMTGVDYISSAGLRVCLILLKTAKSRGGIVALAGMQPYCLSVLEMAGMALAFPRFESSTRAVSYCQQVAREKGYLNNWDSLEHLDSNCGSFIVVPGSGGRGAVEVMGDVKNVLYSRVSVAHLSSKKFAETEYSIGLGGLGDRLDDYFTIMGEMMTIGGTMVWLPTDGHDTPDFLIPRTDTGMVTVRTGFNVSLSGGFNELMMFTSSEPGGTTITGLYRALFDLAKKRRPDFHGVLGLAMRAEMGAVFGSGIKRSPIVDYSPPNGEMVTSPVNSEEWFDFDDVPRHSGITGLLCGLGADLTMDLAYYDQEQLNCVFYLNPANTGGKDQMLHNHVVVFEKMPFPEKAANLEEQIKKVVEKGDFVDMRHLLDSTTIEQAFIGVSYIEEFRPDRS